MSRPVRVLFDSDIFSLQAHGGVSRYFTELIASLPQYNVVPILFAPFNVNAHLRNLSPAGSFSFPFPTPLDNFLARSIIRRIQGVTDRVASRVATFDLLHQTYYGRSFPNVSSTVVTVHDMIPELFPDAFAGQDPHKGKAEAVRRAALVLTVSERTRADLNTYFPDLTALITVVPLAVDESLFASRARDAGGEDNTVLFVGKRDGYKNFGTFAEAVARILVDRPELRVICVGGGRLKDEELEPFLRRGVGKRISQTRVADDDLPGFYRRASVFVFPSRYEGFGLPILEAFASGCPVAISMASCFPEVADDAAAYFDPASADSIEETLRRVTFDPAWREELRERGRRRLSHFSWKRTAELTAKAYREVLSFRA